MSLCVNAEPLPSGDGLRRLVVDALSGLIGNGRVVAESLALPGAPILALDGSGVPVVVCFDGGADGGVIMNGLRAVAALRDNEAFWLPLCPALAELDNLNDLRLLALVAGRDEAAMQLQNGHDLQVMSIRAVRVNGELALLAEAVVDATQAAPEAADDATPASGHVSRFRSGDAALTGAESAFFDRL